MTGQINTKSLKAALKRLAAFHDARASLPILEHVHMEASDGRARLTVYDLSKSLTATVEMEGADTFAVAVKFRDFRKIIDKVKADTVGLDFHPDADNPEITIGTGRMHFTLKAKPASEFPVVPVPDEVSATSDTTWDAFISEAAFVKAASSTDKPTNFTSGILFALRPGALELIGTDGHRLHLTRIDGTHAITDGDPPRRTAALVPTATIHAMTKLKLDKGATVRIGFAENIMLWSVPSEGVDGVSHLMDTPYPDYHKVIPDDCESRFGLHIPETIEALQALSIVASERDGRDMIVVNANGTLNLEARAESMGHASAVVPCTHIAGTDRKFALNVFYMIETLQLADGDVTLATNGGLEPARFDYQGTDRIAVIMPVRLPE